MGLFSSAFEADESFGIGRTIESVRLISHDVKHPYDVIRTA